MTSVKSRRELYAEATRRTLLDTGRRKFVEQGYLAVSAEDLVHSAGLSRGALYHHFDGKQGLFQEVLEEQEARAGRRIADAMARADDDPWRQAMAGMGTFLDICAEREYREIVLFQGPIALGWKRWREIDRRHLGEVLTAGVQRLLDAGLVREHPAELLAAALYGSLTELSLVIAEADDPAAARTRVGHVVGDLLSGLTA